MFFTHDLNFDDAEIYQKFEFDASYHQATWEHYYSVYTHAFSLAVKQGLAGNYAFNGAAHGLMFLLRHVIELNLKYNLTLNGGTVPNSHIIDDLLKAFPDDSVIPETFKTAIEIFNTDGDGSCWRYYSSKDDVPFFGKAEQIEMAAIIEKLNSVPSSSGFIILPVCAPFDYDNKKIAWDLTLHIGQVDNEWHVKGEFDVLTILMIKAIEVGKAQIKDIYLALLFNIRHGIELALKANVWSIQPVTDEISQKNIDGEHSLSVLYNKLKAYLESRDWNKVTPETHQQYLNYKLKFDKLKETLHQWDNHSRAFRFPFDKSGEAHRMNLAKTDIRELIKLYQETDPFLLFTTNVLIENGILPYDPETHN